jgi:hypothetical protein
VLSPFGSYVRADGPMATHTADCSDCDFRINKVPAQGWPNGTKRPSYLYRGNYPSTISKDRGETWHPDNLEGTSDQLAQWGDESVITGYVPQVCGFVCVCNAWHVDCPMI